MCKERKVSQQIEESEEMLSVRKNQSERNEEEPEEILEEDEEDDDFLTDSLYKGMSNFLAIVIVCGICFFLGRYIQPYDTETYNQGYADAVKDLIALEEYGYGENTSSIANEIAIFFYDYGVMDGVQLNNLITEIMMDDDISDEISNYYLERYNEIWDKSKVNIDDINGLIKELENIFYSETL